MVASKGLHSEYSSEGRFSPAFGAKRVAGVGYGSSGTSALRAGAKSIAGRGAKAPLPLEIAGTEDWTTDEEWLAASRAAWEQSCGPSPKPAGALPLREGYLPRPGFFYLNAAVGHGRPLTIALLMNSSPTLLKWFVS